MKVYHFRADLKCHLANGDTQIIHAYRVNVEAINKASARDMVSAIATEMVHDEGSALLDAPMDFLEILRLREDHAY
jgi:hypothetical protein